MSRVEDLLEEIRSTEKQSQERDAYLNGLITELTEALSKLGDVQHFDEELKTSIGQALGKINTTLEALSKVTLRVDVPDVAKTNTRLTQIVQEIKEQNEKMTSTISSLVTANNEKYGALIDKAIRLIELSANRNSKDIADLIVAIQSKEQSESPDYSQHLMEISKGLSTKTSPKEWNFVIQRRNNGRMDSITATAK